MHKTCTCGHEIELKIRTVIFNNTIEVDNVPVLTCECCNNSEVFSPVKTHLVNLLRQYGSISTNTNIKFNEFNEVAGIIKQLVELGVGTKGLSTLIDERINQLLDILNLARSLADEQWVADVLNKLTQLSDRSLFALPK